MQASTRECTLGHATSEQYPQYTVRLLVNATAILAVAYALALGLFIVFRPEAVAWWAVVLALGLIALPLTLMWWEHGHQHR